jgi:transcriptional regulator with XRE-family HTH domain
MKNTKLRSLRLQAKLTQRSAAELVGVCTRTWERWENGATQISKARLEYFALKLQLLEKEK